MGKSGMLVFIVYLLFGLYLINSSFSLISMPDFIQSIDNWIIFVTGVLVIIGGMKYLRRSPPRSNFNLLP
jgi:predicted membrane channel-forming protein YqfA (hemolysin III family)